MYLLLVLVTGLIEMSRALERCVNVITQSVIDAYISCKYEAANMENAMEINLAYWYLNETRDLHVPGESFRDKDLNL